MILNSFDLFAESLKVSLFGLVYKF